MARVRPARPADADALVRLRSELLPAMAPEENRREVRETLAGRPPANLPFVFLVAEDERAGLAGFAAVRLRSHAEGCDPGRPVGYLEEWYVAPGHRRAGIGRALVAAAADWARAQGAAALASDAGISDEGAQRAHRAVGFDEVERAVLYRLPLGAGSTARAGRVRAHRWVGALGLLGFVASGLHMRAGFPELHGGDGAIRFAFRANHVYLLMAALLNLLAAAAPPPAGRARRFAASALLLAGPALLAAAYLLEAPGGAPERPLTTAGVACLLAGTLLTVAARRPRG